MIGEIRKKRLIEAMVDAGLDGLVLYGNAWQNDYLRYAADFGILEGEGLAVVTRDGDVTLYLDDALEGERASVECPEVKTVVASNLIETVSGVHRPARQQPHRGRPEAAPAVRACRAPRRRSCVSRMRQHLSTGC